MNNKIDNRINDMFDSRMFDEDFLNLKLKHDVEKGLLGHQTLHVFNLVSSFKKINVVIDGSDTGTGKSYTSIAVAAQLGFEPIIICPKTLISMWRKVCVKFNIKPLCITNYEIIRNGYIMVNDKKQVPSFLKINDDGEYVWSVKKNTIIIFDEAHKCKNSKSLNGKLLLSTKNMAKTLLLSATLADTPHNFHVFGYIMGFYKNIKSAKSWITSITVVGTIFC